MVSVERRHLRSRRRLDQHHVADRMAERVVDLLEMVEVEQEGRARPCPDSTASRQPLAEQRAIGEPGQRVVMRHVHHVLADAPPFGNVAEEDGKPVAASDRHVMSSQMRTPSR